MDYNWHPTKKIRRETDLVTVILSCDATSRDSELSAPRKSPYADLLRSFPFSFFRRIFFVLSDMLDGLCPCVIVSNTLPGHMLLGLDWWAILMVARAVGAHGHTKV